MTKLTEASQSFCAHAYVCALAHDLIRACVRACVRARKSYRCILEYFLGLSSELEFLHNPVPSRIQLSHNPSGGNPEACHPTPKRLENDKTRIWSRERTPKLCEAMHVLWSVLDHSVSLLASNDRLQAEERDCLESSPAERKYQRVTILEDLFVPPVALEANLNEAKVLLIGCDPSHCKAHQHVNCA